MAILTQNADSIVDRLRTPVPLTVVDEQIKAGRERVVREAQRDSSGTFRRLLAQAEKTHESRDIVYAIAAGCETVPRYVATTSKDFARLLAVVRQGDPAHSLEYRRAAYVMEANVHLAPVTETLRGDPNGRIRRALLDAYPNDPIVWRRAANETMYVSRFTGPTDARRVAAWWERWPSHLNDRFPPYYRAGAQMQAWLGIASSTKSEEDALKAEKFYHAWAKLLPPSQKDDVKFFGDAVRGVKGLSGLN